jgi:hypothetical protein
MTKPSRLRRACSASLLIVLAAISLVTQASAITLSIKNDDLRALRCTVLFAHWVTIDVGRIAAGEVATVAMTRGREPGSLYIPRFDGRPMMIENIICGADPDWSNSVDQLPLIAVRDSAASSYEIACRAAPRIVCTAPHEILDEDKRTSVEDK